MKYVIPEHPPLPCYQLSERTLIGRGHKRDCHAHPDAPNLCIKVARHADRWQESAIEWYYITHLKQRRVPLDHIIDCYGWVQTNYGSGLVVERIRDGDGSPALTLCDAISAGKVDMNQTDIMLRKLKRWAISHGVAVAELNEVNLMVRKQGNDTNLVFIDGIGSRRKADWKFTLYQRYPWFARMKTKRQWKRQEKEMRRALRSG